MFDDPEMQFLEAELQKYAEMSYQELAELKGRVPVEAPNHLQGRDFMRHVREVSDQRLEVRMLYVVERNEAFPEEDILNAIDVTADDFVWPDDIPKDGEVEIMESSMGQWFTVDTSGEIEWTSFEHEDDD
ncbi:MAG: hypothetical protein AAGL69_14800 [Pseudomonadota bacterium]